MPKTILLIEDNADSQKIYHNRLEQEGYQVIVATNGQEGLKKANEMKPQLILLDLLMPVVSGKEFLISLRKKSESAGIPIIILSNISDPEITVNNRRQEEGLERKMKNNLEVDEYLIKTNSSLDQIIASIKKIIG